jgi:hypothetical protein
VKLLKMLVPSTAHMYITKQCVHSSHTKKSFQPGALILWKHSRYRLGIEIELKCVASKVCPTQNNIISSHMYNS